MRRSATCRSPIRSSPTSSRKASATASAAVSSAAGREDAGDDANQGDDDPAADPQQQSVDRLEALVHLAPQVPDVPIDPGEALVHPRIDPGEALLDSAREVIESFVWPGRTLHCSQATRERVTKGDFGVTKRA